MSDGGESPKSVQEAPAAAAPGEPMDLNTAIQVVMKKALAHDGLARGLHESARAIERGQAQLAILADDCNQPDYKKLIEALCAEQSVNLISVPEQQTLGQWAGLCKIDSEGEARKVVKCSCAVITDYGEETEGLAILQEYLKSRVPDLPHGGGSGNGGTADGRVFKFRLLCIDQNSMRSLLALALALAAVHSAAGAAWWQPVRTGLNCSAACVRINKAAWAINGGSASRALCSVTLNNKRYHGTKVDPAGTCSYTYLNAAGQAQAGVSGAAAGAFMCGCTTAGTCWVPGSCPTGSTGISPTNACVAEKSACASTFSEGTVAKCAADGKLYKLERGKLRQFPSQEIYASYGSPPPTFVDRSTSCCQLSRCAVGAALPMGSCSTLIGFTFYPGKESGWENIAGPGGVDNAPYKGLTAQQLAVKCGPKPHCEGFVRNGQTGEGWLKYGVRPSTTWGSLPTADGCTGLWVKNPPTLPTKCGKLERGIHFNGGDLTTCPELGGTCFYARGVNTIEACCNKCAEKAGCGAFTFKWQDEAHTLGSCALKAATGYTRSYWGEHHSAVIVPQCRLPFCTAYAQGTCKCTACQKGWLPSAGKCVSAAPVTLSASDPAFVDKARTVGPRQMLLVTNYLLEGDSKPTTLELKRKSMFLKGAKIVVQGPGGPVTKAAPDARLFTGQTVFDQKWQAVVALEMDNAYMKQFKKEEDAIDYAADLVGYSDVVFSREVQVDLVIGYISMWPTSKPDPYSSQPDIDKVLDAFRGQWNGSDTSKNPEKTMWEVKCILHESGHIFGAPHTHEWCNLDGAIDTIDCNRIGSDLLGGGYSNIAWTFGKGHPCGRWPERVPGRMQDLVKARAETYKGCFAAEPSDWWGWKVTIATAAGAWFWSGTGTDADVQVKWHCGNTNVTNGYVSLSRLCGTASYTRTKGSWGCFESGNVEQFTLQYYPDDTPATGALLAGNNPVPACLEAGVQPVLSIQIQGQGYTDRWEMDTTQLQLELQYVEKADGMLHIRSRSAWHGGMMQSSAMSAWLLLPRVPMFLDQACG
ncbi:hypothetical protein COHA_007770 [Chlorella ohadii]|uniref:40S ribosomal protein S12 n=1 Tax=Chlorella ohadii TaxID=2649997 RepID=A0AAD5DLA0_9CHLO|nr:hypothetical protein COHA_007770 [Chlorella ohadii]